MNKELIERLSSGHLIGDGSYNHKIRKEAADALKQADKDIADLVGALKWSQEQLEKLTVDNGSGIFVRPTTLPMELTGFGQRMSKNSTLLFKHKR